MSDEDLDEDLDRDSAWYRDSRYPMDQWQRAVENDETQASYMNWLVSQYESDGKDVPQEVLDEIHPPQEYGLNADGTAPLPQKYRDRYGTDHWKQEVEDLDTKNGYESWLWSIVQHDEEWAVEEEARAQAIQLDDATPGSPARPRPRV